ncbi:N-6 DNA methylase [uncultured Duncaniella sp.]|nr:N-6 DNA methylase [uncultured Duncaniella sp.]
MKKAKEEVLEDILFACRDSLRGRAALTDKRDMLLTLVFLKFISERYHDRRAEIEAEYADRPERLAVFINREQEYGRVGVFKLAPEYDWEQLKVVEPNRIAVALDDAASKLMEAQPRLRNALPSALFVNSGTEGNVIKQVMDEIDKISHKKFKEKDLIGRVYEYFLQAFAINANKEDGEFYTPHSIVELIATLIEPFDGTLYDPCCGSGGMFVQCSRFVEQQGGNALAVSTYGQESDPTTYRLAKMNLAVRGIEYHLGDRHASTFTDDMHKGMTFNYIMANPPFNLKKWYDSKLDNDVRWKGYGRPPESNANYAWILHMLSKLEPNNGRAGFLLANGALDDEDTIKIRENLIKGDKIEAIIVLPREMFYATDISVTLWILNENKRGGIQGSRKLRNRKGEILFVDLRSWSENIYEKKFVQLSSEQIARIHKIYTDWQSLPEAAEKYESPELYRSVRIDEIEANNWSLVPSRYIEFVDRADIDTISVFSSFRQDVKKLNQQLTDVASEISILNSTLNSILNSVSDAPFTEIGESIEVVTHQNVLNEDLPVMGLNKDKVFMPTAANLDGVKTTKYLIVGKDMFAFSGMQTGRDKCIRIAYNDSDTRFLISPAYTTFKVIGDAFLPEYLYLWFQRKESDRLGWFLSDSSVRSNLDWSRFISIKVPKPSIEVQRAIVDIYRCARKARSISEEAAQQLKSICPALMQHIIHP